MKNISSVMDNKRFSYFIILTFIAGSLLLIAVQLNSAGNTKALIQNNNTLLSELRSSNHLREIDRDILGVESRIRASIATNDTTHLEGIDQKINQIENFLDSLSKDNVNAEEEKLIHRLSVLAMEKKTTKDKLLNRYLSVGNMDDNTSIANPRARNISNEITRITAKIYESRKLNMVELSQKSEEMGQKARFYDISILILLILGGSVVGYHILRQFKRQRLLINELDIAEKKALVAAQTKENFLANMSHEIRTPLSGILGFTNLLQKRPLDETSAEFVSSIQRSGENLMAIINDILDLSKIEAGMMRITPGIFSINGLVNSVETFFTERAREKGLTLSSTIDPSIPDTLVGDATRLTQILVNLIGNAIKFTHQGNIAVEIYSKQQTEKEAILGFKISDTGIGIDREKLTEIFERFNQGEDSTTRNYGGTGLGLSIVKSLIVLQNGNIEVSSEQGKGTTFHFYIPYGIAEEQLTVLPSADPHYFKDKSNTPLKVLVVDDNVINQSLMKHLLSQWNIDFHIASNGLEAVSYLKSNACDLVLMDIQMPQMDGYAATQKIREELRLDIPVIAMTAHALAGERERCLSRGMNEYISKPVNEEELFTLISKFGLKEKNSQEEKSEIPSSDYRYIDLTYMQTVSGGDRSFEQMVTQQFIENIPNHVQKLTTAYENGDFQGVKLWAHDLKSSIAIMGLHPVLKEKLDILETASGENPDLQKILEEVQEVLSEAVSEAEAFSKTI
ncbi:signal transduction histidine kinase/CheY-like chemotaxis protein [Chryseobacterium bernardetii]|uniref:histidine kinase n=2 Tax=Chryseobacterium TaxID=59732 RepID=A0A543EIN0_9FLAO|nr:MULTISPECIES: hybrid sensor histidine kinase/response regulator [Chryseobacterium]MDR6369870.1 signal transduction histidine kinase/CheY-like chemotaxis protein [Chryseobacterium vietnamense]MDR6440887.1 signal transduction histidine kinase/CheY-like chemotaxis protein [Chryseobacterium bernardetii]TQM21434.1 signal transduction histidine kinase [Chryseobacterium aquifrigidense]